MLQHLKNRRRLSQTSWKCGVVSSVSCGCGSDREIKCVIIPRINTCDRYWASNEYEQSSKHKQCPPQRNWNLYGQTPSTPSHSVKTNRRSIINFWQTFVNFYNVHSPQPISKITVVIKNRKYLEPIEPIEPVEPKVWHRKIRRQPKIISIHIYKALKLHSFFASIEQTSHVE